MHLMQNYSERLTSKMRNLLKKLPKRLLKYHNIDKFSLLKYQQFLEIFGSQMPFWLRPCHLNLINV